VIVAENVFVSGKDVIVIENVFVGQREVFVPVFGSTITNTCFSDPRTRFLSGHGHGSFLSDTTACHAPFRM
jgi:hypothetical protein